MPPDEREAGSGDVFVPFEARGPAARLVEFSQPLVDAAGDDPKAIDRAFQLGMIFWNFGGAAEAGDDKFVREQLSAMENEISRSDGDVREFRAVVVMMFDRYAAMRPAARTHLERIIAGMQGVDRSPVLSRFGWAGRIASAVKRFCRERRGS